MKQTVYNSHIKRVRQAFDRIVGMKKLSQRIKISLDDCETIFNIICVELGDAEYSLSSLERVEIRRLVDK